MLTEFERERFHVLQQREDDGSLLPSEREELRAFVQQIEDAEAAYLRPATERIRLQRLRSEDQNRALEALIRRKARLAQRLERVLEFSEAERNRINSEVNLILNPASPGTGR